MLWFYVTSLCDVTMCSHTKPQSTVCTSLHVTAPNTNLHPPCKKSTDLTACGWTQLECSTTRLPVEPTLAWVGICQLGCSTTRLPVEPLVNKYGRFREHVYVIYTIQDRCVYFLVALAHTQRDGHVTARSGAWGPGTHEGRETGSYEGCSYDVRGYRVI